MKPEVQAYIGTANDQMYVSCTSTFTLENRIHWCRDELSMTIQRYHTLARTTKDR